MRDLCTTKKYDLSHLNDGQLQSVLDWLKENDEGWRCLNIIQHKYLSFLNTIFDNVVISSGWYNSSHLTGELTNALELFEEELKTYQITEYSTGDFRDLGIKQGTIQATTKDQAWLFHKESNGLQEQEKGFFSFVEVNQEPNGYEITVNNMGRVEPKYPNYSCDKSDVYERADKLMQDGKQHGLKIVVTFEKL